jgi:hypothetical protein
MARKKATHHDSGGRTEGGATGQVIVQVPEQLRGRLADIVAVTDRFCDQHLDAEFKRLCRAMVAELFVEGCPLDSGKAAGWAAGILYSVAWVNFLGDPSQPHHMKAEDIARAVGVSPATLMNRAKVIREGLDLRRTDPRWSTRNMLERNPLVWMVEVNGVPCDIRQAPRHVQEEAVRRGIIPFVPGEGQDEEGGR